MKMIVVTDFAKIIVQVSGGCVQIVNSRKKGSIIGK